jgi:O-methyltransferase
MGDTLSLQKNRMAPIGSKILKTIGLKVIKYDRSNPFPDMEKEFLALSEKCIPYTMTSMERLYAVYKSVEYLIKNNIEGDYVECGVWRGGSSMMIAYTLMLNQRLDKKIYLYDTYEGMTEPTEKDINYAKQSAEKKFKENVLPDRGTNWCRSEMDTGYPIENIIFVKGKVEETIPACIPHKIALLRLDTDWYESTKHEMQHLYPILSQQGIIIIDDYGHWLGCRKAIDEYFSENNIGIFLNRIDYTGRLGIKS